MTLQPDEGDKIGPQDGVDADRQPPPSGASTSAMAIGDTSSGNPLASDPRDGHNFHVDVVPSPSEAEGTGDTGGETEVADPSIGMYTYHDDVGSHSPCLSC